MLRQNTNALGIIFPNSYDNTVPELVTERAMASIPFAGRYRMVDFVLSSMANCGISNVSIVVRKNYHSLMDHLGTGREWDMARRHGGLNIVPPFAEKGVRIYSGRVEALGSILSFLENQKERYVVMSDANIAINYDFNALLAAHQASGADVTVAYQKTEIPEGRKNDNYTLTIDADGRVTELLFNDYRSGVQNLDLDIYVMERETLIKLVKDATARGLIYFERDILAHNVNILNIHALEYTGYVAHVCDMKSYFDENLKLIDDRNLEALFPKGQPHLHQDPRRQPHPLRHRFQGRGFHSGRRLRHRRHRGELRAVPRRQGQEGCRRQELRPDAGHRGRAQRGAGLRCDRQEREDHRRQEAVRHRELPRVRAEEPHRLIEQYP